MASKRDVSEQQNEVHRKILSKLMKEEGNKYCVDCRQRNPTWASVNLGVFMCLSCSGIHRSLGVHISQVRSCTLDTWLPRQVEFMGAMGNGKANLYWESGLPGDFRRPAGTGTGPTPELEKFIREKYVDKRYAAKDAPPPNIENYSNHPYVKVDAKTAAPASAPALQASAVKPSATPAPVAAPTTSLLDLDAAPASSAKASGDDPFAAFVSAPPAGTASQPGGDWGDFESSTSVSTTTTTKAAATKATELASSAGDPFGAFVDGTLATKLDSVHVNDASQASAKKDSLPKKSAEDILKLYDSAGIKKDAFSGDNLFGAPIENAPLPPLGASNQPYPGMQARPAGMGMQLGMPGMQGMPGMGMGGMMGMQQGFMGMPQGMPGWQQGMQQGIPGMQQGMPGMQQGMPGMQQGFMGMQPSMGMQPGMNMGMGMQPGMGMHPGMGMMPGMGMSMPGMAPQPGMGMMPPGAPANMQAASMQFRL